MSETFADYDNPWKESLGQYFEPFLVFFFPKVHALIDWSRPPQSLDKELQQIAPESESGLLLADKLFQVWQPNNEQAWILIHVEVQSQEQSNFAQRMYIYNYRVFDLYRRSVISLAVLGDERANWRPDLYSYALAGCEVSLKFPIVKLLDYETQWETLEESNNPFAVMVMAHLRTKATTGKPIERKQWKWNLVRRLFERGYSRGEVVNLFRLIDRMMALPIELQQEFKEEIRRYQEERQMPFLSQIELMAKQEGIQQNAREAVLEVLELRFEELSEELIAAVNGIEDTFLLKQLHRQAITLNSLAEFQQILQQNQERRHENLE